MRLVSADAWLGDPTNRGWLDGDADAGRRWLVRTHLAAHESATIHDIAAWSGLSIRELRNTVTVLDDQLITRRGPDETHLVDLADAPANTTNGHAPVALLPWWDAVLLAYRDRTRLLGDLDRQAIQERDYIRPTVLLDGHVAARSSRGRPHRVGPATHQDRRRGRQRAWRHTPGRHERRGGRPAAPRRSGVDAFGHGLRRGLAGHRR